jgi:hypothetical protein
MDNASRYKSLFEERKNQANVILEKKANNTDPYGDEVEHEIRELIYALNRLDFIYTTGSCSGHFRRRDEFKLYKREPWENECFFTPGYIDFVFKPCEQTDRFLSKLKVLVSKYERAHFEYTNPIIETDDACLQDLRFCLHFEKSIEYRSHAFKLIQAIVNHLKPPKVLTLEEGMRRNEHRKALIYDLYRLALEHIVQQQPVLEVKLIS